jgi:hypothetical protein
MNKKEFQELPDEEKLKMIYELLTMVNDYALKCFVAGWRKLPSTISIWDLEKVRKMILTYGEESVRDGFIAARDNGVEKLIYVENVARSSYEKKSVKKNIQQHEELKKEDTQKFWNPSEDSEWGKAINKLIKSKTI